MKNKFRYLVFAFVAFMSVRSSFAVDYYNYDQCLGFLILGSNHLYPNLPPGVGTVMVGGGKVEGKHKTTGLIWSTPLASITPNAFYTKVGQAAVRLDTKGWLVTNAEIKATVWRNGKPNPEQIVKCDMKSATSSLLLLPPAPPAAACPPRDSFLLLTLYWKYETEVGCTAEFKLTSQR